MTVKTSNMKKIHNYDALYRAMIRMNYIHAGMYPTVDVWLASVTVGENWYSNGVEEFKIIRSFGNGIDSLFNFRSIISKNMEQLMFIA